MSIITLDDRGIILPCPACGQKNRTAFERLGETGQCGKCQAEIPAPAAPFDISSEAHFNRLISASPLPVVIDFWAEWCGPCKMVAPEFVKVAASGAGQFLVGKVNTETVPALSARFSVRSIPTMAVFVKGQEAARTAGARPAADILAWVRQAITA